MNSWQMYEVLYKCLIASSGKRILRPLQQREVRSVFLEYLLSTCQKDDLFVFWHYLHSNRKGTFGLQSE